MEGIILPFPRIKGNFVLLYVYILRIMLFMVVVFVVFVLVVSVCILGSQRADFYVICRQ